MERGYKTNSDINKRSTSPITNTSPGFLCHLPFSSFLAIAQVNKVQNKVKDMQYI